MDTAIVTITCPHCGGEVKGIQAMEHEQTVPCTYCGTELHVPHVGEEIVREVVVQAPAPAPLVDPTPNPLLDPVYSDSLRPTPNRTVQLVVGVLAVLGMLIVVFALRCDADQTLDQMKQDDQLANTCKAACKQQCDSAPPKHATSPTGDPGLDQDLERTMRDADRMECEIDCEQTHDCIHLHAPPR